MNSLTIIGILLIFGMSNFVWYWQGFRDGKREGWTRGRSMSRQEFWSE
jgi:hypothetical protein